MKDIGEVDPISDQDYRVLDEVREVLERHGYSDRFGVCLLHKHLDIADDERAVEYTDAPARISQVVVEKAVPVSQDGLIETMWKFRTGQGAVAGMICVQQCQYAGGHRRVHVKQAV